MMTNLKNHLVEFSQGWESYVNECMRLVDDSLRFYVTKDHRVYEVLNMLGEIMGIEDDIEFRNEENLGHYIRTPYSYKPLVGRKYTPKTHIDLGQGMLDLVYELKNLTK